MQQVPIGGFERRADYRIFQNAEGMDEVGRWRQDNSGGVHPLDSSEALQVAVTESFLSGYRFLFPDPTAWNVSGTQEDQQTDRLLTGVTIDPVGGRRLVLWIDAATHLPDHAEIELTVGREVVTYADYRAEGGITLPHVIALEHEDESETGRVVVGAYRVASSQTRLHRPMRRFADVAWKDGKRRTDVPGYFDPETGFFYVMAMLNGSGPSAFILDTGGHDILTPDTVKRLGLRTEGSGFSAGAGEGTSPTEYTRLKTIALGNVVVAEQPFLVLHVDLGTTTFGGLQSVPVAGILGLELFERFAVTTDYVDGTMTLEDPLQASVTGDRTAIRFTSDMPLVEAALGGAAGWFELDSGNNTDIIVFKRWADAHGLRPSAVNGADMHGSSVGGDVVLQPGEATTLTLGPLRLDRMAVMFSNSAKGSLSARYEAGNVGNSVLRRCRATYNYARSIISLVPVATRSP